MTCYPLNINYYQTKYQPCQPGVRQLKSVRVLTVAFGKNSWPEVSTRKSLDSAIVTESPTMQHQMDIKLSLPGFLCGVLRLFSPLLKISVRLFHLATAASGGLCVFVIFATVFFLFDA